MASKSHTCTRDAYRKGLRVGKREFIVRHLFELWVQCCRGTRAWSVYEIAIFRDESLSQNGNGILFRFIGGTRGVTHVMYRRTRIVAFRFNLRNRQIQSTRNKRDSLRLRNKIIAYSKYRLFVDPRFED